MFNMLDFCTELKLAIITHLPPQDLKNLALCCKKLNRLVQPSIWASRKIPYWKLRKPFNQRLAGLCKEIWLQNDCSDETLEALGQYGDEHTIEEGLSLLLSSCNPRILHCEYHPILSHTSLVVSHMDHLRELYLSGRSFHDNEINQICSTCIANLKILSITQSKNTDQAYVNIGRLDCLDKLEIVNSNITDTVVKNIKSQKLKELILSQCDLLTKVGISYLSSFVSLQCLDLSGHPERIRPGINDKCVECIKNLVNLRELDISHNELLTDVSLKHISALIELTKLSVAGNDVTDAGLLHLKKLKKLEDLDLSRCLELELQNVGCLSDLPISKLWLEGTNIMDEDLDGFHAFHLLKILDLSDCGISANGVQYIVKLNSLEELYLEGSALDAVGFFQLKQDLPNVIIHSDYDFPPGNGLAYFNFFGDSNAS